MQITLTPVTVYSVQLKDGRTALLQRTSSWEGMERLARVDKPDQVLIVDVPDQTYRALFAGLFTKTLGTGDEPLRAVVMKATQQLGAELVPAAPEDEQQQAAQAQEGGAA